MREAFFASLLLAAASFPVASQTPEVVERSSSPSGIRIPNEAGVRIQPQAGATVSPERDKAARSAGSAAGSPVNIKGKTRINATARNVNAVSVGKNNRSGNAVGAIGSK